MPRSPCCAPRRVGSVPKARGRDGDEDPRYLREQLITCIGNKRGLLHTIERAVLRVKRRLGRDRLRALDAFAGSGVVSRLFKRYAEWLVSNDLEPYAAVIGRCYLANRSQLPLALLREHHRRITAAEANQVRDGIIRRLYAPQRDDAIRPGERVFYTVANAIRIDSIRAAIDSIEPPFQPFFLAPLLSEASIHTNTAGVFKGFYKGTDGVGRFGGANADALARILGRIQLPFPRFSRFACETTIRQEDANRLVRSLPDLDLAYFDPPYNQHPYGSNYFMLNLIVENREPGAMSPVSGIPLDWNRSNYNKRSRALDVLADLITQTRASHILVSYNSEGFIARPHLEAALRRHGRVESFDTTYNAFRGSRNLRRRPIHVQEHLFLLERR